MSSTPKYTLYYFNMKGRAEPIRLAFAVTGTPFEDSYVDPHKWQEFKQSDLLPYGVVPVLEVDNGGTKEIIAESSAIMAYVVAAHGQGTLQETDPMAVARIEEVMSALGDLQMKIGMSAREQDEAKKKEMRVKLASETIPQQMSRINARMHPDGYASPKGKLSKADLLIHQAVSWLKSGMLDGIPTDIADSYDRIIRCHANVDANEKVKQYYASKAK